MKKEIDSAKASTNILAIVIIAFATIAALYLNYFMSFSAPIKAVIWIFWLVLVSLFASFTSKGKQAISYIKESKVELQKVVWPSRHETIQTTTIVIVMVTITGFVLWGVDSVMMWTIGKLTHLG